MHIKVFKLPVRNSISIYFPIIFVFTANQCHWLHNTKLRLLYHFLLSLNCNLNQAQGMIVHKSHFGATRVFSFLFSRFLDFLLLRVVHGEHIAEYYVLNSYLAVPILHYGTAKQTRTRKVVCASLHMLGENSPFVVFSCILNTTFKVQIYEKNIVPINCSLFVCRLFGVHIFILYIHPSQSAGDRGDTRKSAIFSERR